MTTTQTIAHVEHIIAILEQVQELAEPLADELQPCALDDPALYQAWCNLAGIRPEFALRDLRRWEERQR